MRVDEHGDLVENAHRDEVALFAIEDRGYSRGTGTLLLPSGRQVSTSHEEGCLELSNALARHVWGEWMNEALDWLMGAGAPSLSFKELGTSHEGVVRSYEKKQQSDPTGALKTYDNGDPMYQLVVTLATEERDPENPDDDGLRRLYVKGNMLVALRDAIKRSQHKGDIVGGTVGVKYVKDGQATRAGFTAPKEYAAKFTPPPAETVTDGYGYDEEPF